jgi:transcriptional regulator with XRE-family HTH domain
MRINDSKIKAQIGPVIRSNRLALHMSQGQLGKNAALTREFVNQIENGKRIPSSESLARIASCFNKKAPDLIEEAKLGEVNKRVLLAMHLKRVLETEDDETLRELIEYSKTLRGSRGRPVV